MAKIPEDPFALFDEWLAQAKQSEINDPGAVCLSTATKDGIPNARMVLLKGHDERGFKFHTNSESQKGLELEENPRAALCFYWKSLRKQVRVQGIIEQVPDQEADLYFSQRPLKRRIGAWASQQSRPLESREALEDACNQVEVKYPDPENIPRPPYWNGYLVIPENIEFWWDNPDRLHDRFIFKKDSNNNWLKAQRLYP